ncbi:MAG: PhoH family protein [Planctomycetes bacterium]|nr:PhoH family protein [Planctomycetota bacterium]
MSETNISVVGSQALLSLFGTRDQHLRQVRDAFGVKISARNDEVHVEGTESAVAQATRVLEQLKSLAERRGHVTPDDVALAIEAVTGKGAPADAPVIETMHAGRKVQPRTLGQARYVRSIMENDVVFCHGPAGTGKTYLAVAMAVQALRQERVRKIVLVRPAVEAGESLGYLPGDLQAKINPYLRPLLDALREMIDFDQMKRLTELDVIEVAPLAYMRGRTLNEAFIILDEAQNTTVAQMKMFLTRMGRGSKIVVSGDTTQIDLPPHVSSGLIDAHRRLHDIDGLAHITLTGADIVRHRLVQEIVRAYEDGPRRH